MRLPARSVAVLALLALATGCTSAPPQQPVAARGQSCGGAGKFAEGGERATLWIRNSSEFRASSEGIYRNATAALARALADTRWTAEPTQNGDYSALPPAVIMDIDDTVLDNSEAQARMILHGACAATFEAFWDAWVAERAAPSVPGAADFIRAARGMKDAQGRAVRVFLITNRECAPRTWNAAPCPQQDDTLANLRALGLDSPTLTEDLMIRGEYPDWESEKEPRRQLVARDYRILLNVGDDLADFLPAVRRATVAARERARCARRDWWGERWFLIPNPMYGSWQQVMGPDLEALLAAKPQIDEDCAKP